jgi:hypothetical protein
MSDILETRRAQCRIDTDDDAEDNLLLLYFGAARKKAENLTNRKLYDSESDVPEADSYGLVIEDDILLALLLLVGHWFENREQVNVGNIVTTFLSASSLFLSLIALYHYEEVACRPGDYVIVLRSSISHRPVTLPDSLLKSGRKEDHLGGSAGY